MGLILVGIVVRHNGEPAVISLAEGGPAGKKSLSMN
jgi:hypothetical protein